MKKVLIILIVIILFAVVFLPIIPTTKKVYKNCGASSYNYGCPPKYELKFTNLVDLLGIGLIRAR